MKIGDWQVDLLSDGTFKLDGGAMFGIVPKPLWTRLTEADEKNRISLGTNCLLLRGRDRVVVVETGMGGRWSDKLRGIYAIERPEGGLLGGLERLGVDPGDVTDCVLTHLHFDHAGGAVVEEEGELRPAFPNAAHHVQADQWAWAHDPSPRDAGSFRLEDFEALERADLVLHEGPATIHEDLDLTPAHGHTPGLQVVRLASGGETLLFPSDVVPTTAHLKAAYVMAYDLFPMTTVEEKTAWLERAAEGGWIVVFGHEPGPPAVRLAREGEAIRVAERLG